MRSSRGPIAPFTRPSEPDGIGSSRTGTRTLCSRRRGVSWGGIPAVPGYHGPMTASGDLPALPSNAELARIFHDIGDMLEVKGELVFKTVAYHKAADAIAHSPVEVSRAYLEGRPPRISGVGEAIAKKIEELARTGRMAFYEALREEVPPR